MITQQKLYEAAIRYLERYSSSAANLRRVLQRRIKRFEFRTGEKSPAEAAQWIEIVVDKCIALGFVNDARYAENLIASLRRQGRSRRYIQQALSLKGVKSALPEDGEAEEEAATRLAKRRRLTNTDKDLAKLVRAGFSLGVARKILKERS
jgi:regulatory protein